MLIDRETAREAIALLSTAIAELVEDANPAAIEALRGPNAVGRIDSLVALGEDVAVLARAIGVLERRSRRAGP